jgi:DNA-binding transcriptional ArsR family regulator
MTPEYDQKKRLLNSEVAYQILRTLERNPREEGMYSKEIAEELDKSRNSVANYLKLLRDFGLIKRTKRNQAQYYDIDYEGIFDFWKSETLEKLNQIVKETKEDELEFPTSEKLPDSINEINEEISSLRPENIESLTKKFEEDIEKGLFQDGEDTIGFIHLWIWWHLDHVEESNIQEMLFDGLREGLEHQRMTLKQNESLEEFDEAYERLNTILNLITGNLSIKENAMTLLLFTEMEETGFWEAFFEEYDPEDLANMVSERIED